METNKIFLLDRKFKKEAEFVTYFNKKIKDDGGFIHKISDFSPGAKPFDCICQYKGYSYAIEAKYTKSKSFYPYKMLRGSSPSKPGGQVKSLDLFEKNGGISLVVVYSSGIGGYVSFRFSDIGRDYRFTS